MKFAEYSNSTKGDTTFDFNKPVVFTLTVWIVSSRLGWYNVYPLQNDCIVQYNELYSQRFEHAQLQLI